MGIKSQASTQLLLENSKHLLLKVKRIGISMRIGDKALLSGTMHIPKYVVGNEHLVWQHLFPINDGLEDRSFRFCLVQKVGSEDVILMKLTVDGIVEIVDVGSADDPEALLFEFGEHFQGRQVKSRSKEFAKQAAFS